MQNNDGNDKRYIEKASSNKKKLTKYAKEKLCDVGRHFMDDQGLPGPVSILFDILKKEKWMNFEVSNYLEKEQWTSQFPLLEMYLVEWVDKAYC